MKIAVIGAGISGMMAAHRLSTSHDVTLYEGQSRLGGHTDTHLIPIGECMFSVDTGFIVFNALNYPLFTAWLEELGVESQRSNMSFGMSCPDSGLEYGTRNLASLFCQKKNIFSPSFLLMLKDLRRFYREAPADADAPRSQTLGSYLEQHGFSDMFARNHLLPMCSALWSQPIDNALDLPISHVVSFMRHHQMLKLFGRPQWQVVKGGSKMYVEAFCSRFHGQIRCDTPVRSVRRGLGQVEVVSDYETEYFDSVFIACHSDQSLSILADPSPLERAILGSIRYQENIAVLHTDRSVMPENVLAWSSWNATVDGDLRGCQVTYWMNLLQGLEGPNFFVTLNPDVDLQSVWIERHYSHPVFDAEALRAQSRRDEIDGVRNTFFCGAYWGWGFHEDGIRSAIQSVTRYESETRDAA